jgi:hypothetical protein
VNEKKDITFSTPIHATHSAKIVKSSVTIMKEGESNSKRIARREIVKNVEALIDL